jgi:hypothetical protein
VTGHPRDLAARGVEAVYGEPLDGVPVVAASPAVAALLAEAHGLVHRTPCALHRYGELTVVDRPPVDRWVEPADGVVERLAAAERPMVLVGPGVAEPAYVPGLHALAAAGSLGVLNTWGAKGVFVWRSRHHWGTVGLQARDFELGGLAGADLVLAAGLDDRESPPALWRRAGAGRDVVEVAPGSLGPIAERWGRPRVELTAPPLMSGLAAVTQAGWTVDAAPLPPTRVTRNHALAVGEGGLVAADPGTSGYWVARTFATTGLGGAVVPARAGARGLAAACVVVARLRAPQRPALAVVDGPAPDPATAAVVEAGERLGVAVPVECWDAGGPALDAEAHLGRLRDAVVADRSAVLPVATDPTQLDHMVEVAGPVVAWQES